jgi:hypothetical protein
VVAIDVVDVVDSPLHPLLAVNWTVFYPSIPAEATVPGHAKIGINGQENPAPNWK